MSGAARFGFLGALALAGACGSQGGGTGAGGFAPTGDLPQAVGGFASATPLPDGKVLIAGGDDGRGLEIPYAEIYDPVTGVFTMTGLMMWARSAHGAVLLKNGRVLIVGSRNSTFSQAETFDPATGTFTPTGAFFGSGMSVTATLLADGKVLVQGTEDYTAQIYDPELSTITVAGSLSAHVHCTATALLDGRVLLTGEWSFPSVGAEIFDPIQRTFAPTGDMRTLRHRHAATLLPDGRVLITGGVGADGTALRSAELYDPATATFTATGDMLAERGGHTATPLPDGRVLVAGGLVVDGKLSEGLAELYDPKTGTFAPTGALGRMFHVAALLPGGSVLVAGGVTQSVYATRTAEVWTDAR